MPRLLVFVLLGLGMFSNSFGQVAVQLNTGTFVNYEPSRNPANDPAYFNPCLYQGRYYLWLQFNVLPTVEEKASLTATGAQLYDYLPSNTFFASFPAGYNFQQLNQYKVYAVTRPLPHYKIDPSLFNGDDISWSVVSDSMRLVRVSFIPSFSKDYLAAALADAGVNFIREDDDESDALRLIIEVDELNKLALHPLVQYIEPVGAPPVLEDEQGVSNHRNDLLMTSDNYAGGRKLDGTGIVIAEGDDGFIGPHIDFTGRIGANASVTTGNHGDHVAGIITGAGNFNPVVRGQAPGAILRAYNYYGDFSLYPAIYNTNLVRVTTHSLGQTCNGGYTTDARTSDLQIRTYPSLMHVHSAGNSGTSSCGGISPGWRTITGGYKAGKNVLAVANLNKSDGISSSSSKGPLKDGRMKPDIAAVGSSVISTQPLNTFSTLSGTSMASPAIAGSLALLYQAYKQASGGVEPNSGLIKAVMMNTADDLGNPGPDFTYGWGRVNSRRAVECIEGSRFLTGSIAQGGQNTHEIVVPANVATAKIMVYWVDKEATAGAAKSLVNNIDTWIISPFGGVIHDPWKLNAGPSPTAATCSAPAVFGIDTLNNVEQVQMSDPGAGTYQLKVSGAAIPQGPQTYYVVYEFLYKNNIVVTHPFGGESFVIGETQRIRWDASGTTGNFSIAYSLNEGSSWTTISSTVASTQKYYDWTVPNSVTSKARIRVSSGIFNDVSDTNFVILPALTGVSFSVVCAGSTRISWNAVAGATGYDVFKLGSKYMEKMASTSLTNVTLSGLESGENWFAVRANLGTRANGRRTNAVAHTNSSAAICVVPLKLISFNATKKGKDVELAWTTEEESGIIKYVVERSSSPSFDHFSGIGEVASHNSNLPKQYQLLDKTTLGKGTWYYRLRIVELGRVIYSKVEVVKWNDSQVDLVIYPNPVSSTLFVQLYKQYNSPVAEIINESGVRVLQKALNTRGNEIDVRSLPAGYYIIIIRDAKEGILASDQFNILR